MDLQIPLNKLKFGHEDGDGINARVTGRDARIAELAANIFANRANAPDRAGLIENLIVKDAGGGFYSVANGNRRLAALHMIDGTEAGVPIPCTLHKVDETRAFEFSLATAITAEQLHPVDQYEAFARLRDRGKISEEIAQTYGMTEREVDQALALGHLSPRVRELWRKGSIKAEIARAFTLAPDHEQQDDLLDELIAELDDGDDLSDLETWQVKERLRPVDDDSGVLVEFVGVDAYIAAGGKVQRDLFGTDHRVSDPKLAKKLADAKLAEECRKFKEQGWSFAVTFESVRNTQHSYGTLKVEPAATDEEKATLAALDAAFHGEDNYYRQGIYHTETFAELTGAEQRAYLDYRALDRAIRERSYTAAMRAKAGCFIGIDEDGFLKIEYGRVKPEEKKAAAKVEAQERRQQAKAEQRQPAADGKPAPAAAPKVLSKALLDRLSAQMIAATRDAIAGDPLLAESPFAEAMAKTLCAMITPDHPFRMPEGVRTKLPTIRQVLDETVFNAAVAKRFDAADYFGSAPKSFVVKAIAEAINTDEARKASAGSKNDLVKFAMANVVKSGWLPKELRSVHYKGPGSDGYKKPAAAPAAKTEPIAAAAAKPAPVNAKPSTTETVRKAKTARAEKAAAVAQKRHVKAQAKPAKKKATTKKR
ncbi:MULTISPECIES: ParB/RepB/Spo0J family partition protein [unclassified Bradyrhizobium]|uniref:ParB/RepB/Spo0J family partition protein n=1 Tax=unclassified Bradyrhizobium TaxID=2631580 RepID=UPI00291665F0|nr:MULTISPECIES: ParB/RepB/Spo0J family partition protein [unclassified Bradyrhizobium]